ncbi:MAG TPA: hypothetical protein VMJ10_03415 [Kofleriaceae bacterium]|nr:hypothetical protein [Kofleriaceae bacterium]
MKKLAMGALLAAGLFACSNNKSSGTKIMVMADGGVDGGGACAGLICCPLTPDNTGCPANEKCTWVIDQKGSGGAASLGHVDCVPCSGSNCTLAVGAPCSQSAPSGGMPGFDDCVAGAYCLPHDDGSGNDDGPGICKTICDPKAGISGSNDAGMGSGSGLLCPSNGSGLQGNYACNGYSGIFGPVGMEVAGVCDSYCDPLADNSFGSQRPAPAGSDCEQPNGPNDEGEGCWGIQCPAGIMLSSTFTCPDNGSRYTCNRAHNRSLYHRSLCSGSAQGSDNPVPCLNSAGDPFSNTCSPGYSPVVQDDMGGSMLWNCVAFCQIADCSPGACGGTGDPNLSGASPHRCLAGSPTGTTDALGKFQEALPGMNLDQCEAQWPYEVAADGSTGMLFIDGTAQGTKSYWSDTVGICFNHSFYYYDSNGDGMLNGSDEVVPECDDATHIKTAGWGSATATTTGPCTAESGCRGAAYFGCMTPTGGGFTSFDGKKVDPKNVKPFDRGIVTMHRPLYHQAR